MDVNTEKTIGKVSKSDGWREGGRMTSSERVHVLVCLFPRATLYSAL